MAEIERTLLAAPSVAHAKVEIYSGVARLARTVWGAEMRRRDAARDTAIVFCHPTANFLGHYALPGLAERGFGAVGLTTRYVGNDTSLLLENCLLDIGAMVRHLRDLGYQRVVLVGNSGGASIVPYYQAQAQQPSVSAPPGGGPDLTQADLQPADGVIMFMAHPSRARLSSEWLDPAIMDEHQPFERDPELDMYDRHNGPPYSAEFVARYRAAQVERNRRISRWAAAQLAALTAAGHAPDGLDDLPFVVHGTTADLRFMDGAIDPSDREIGVSLWGPPQVANYMPAGIGRVSTLRSWLNQWSLDHTFGNALRWLPQITVPVLIEYGTADVTVLPHMGQEMYDAATAAPRELIAIPGAGHYYEGTPELLDQALDAMSDWITRIVLS
ncbi:MAG TPA: alpha/beta hydrolase [Mycobacteriales bacterium]|jgi:pimeloyl-ACP methyl ester carboxylesterase|nr:alpha/beta hydrolase [Mycobacteriales bacterium]